MNYPLAGQKSYLGLPPLQLSSTFLVGPAILASLKRRWAGFTVLLFVFITSIVVHRRGGRDDDYSNNERQKNFNYFWYICDSTAIALWSIWAAYSIKKMEFKSKYALQLTLTLIIAVIACDVYRREYPVHSTKRVQYHATMHTSAVLGTILILFFT